MKQSAPLLLALVALAACGGELKIDNNNGVDNGGDAGTTRDDGTAPSNNTGTDTGGANNSGTQDTGSGGTDTGGNDPDMGAPDLPAVCDPSMCGSGASCQNNVCTCDDGLLGDPYTGCSPADPCASVDCPAGASCNPDGSCSCDPFFNDDGAGGCTPTPPAADLTTRSQADVCAIWTDDFQRASSDFWLIDPGNDECAPGRLHPDELREALHTTSRYRMLVGLHPVSLAASQIQNTQECATMHEAQGSGLSHTPPSNWACYTPAAAAGAGSSNLASGIGNPAGTVGLYVADNNVASLGHRRWVFNPRMGRTAFGHRGRYGAMYAFDGSRNHSVDYVAYPAPGFFPKAAIGGKWSIHGGANYQDTFGVTVTNLTDNSDVPVSNITAPVFGNLASTLSWTVGTSSLPVDTTYRITITDGGGTLVREYETTLVNCP